MTPPALALAPPTGSTAIDVPVTGATGGFISVGVIWVAPVPPVAEEDFIPQFAEEPINFEHADVLRRARAVDELTSSSTIVDGPFDV